MAFAISTPTSSLPHPSSSKTSYLCALSISSVPIPKNAIFQQMKCFPQLGFTQWSGLRQMGVPISQFSVVKFEKKGKCKGKGVYASLFGVGAPEALVIGVVALLVFGPKGLAEVARNLGKTLRAFQPTIRELQEVSREFKSTLEREIGLDDVDTPAPKRPTPTPTPDTTAEDKLEGSETNIEPNGSSSESGEESKDEYVKVKANQLTAALARLQKEQEEEREEKEKAEREKAEILSEAQTPSQDTPQATDTAAEVASPSVMPPSQNPDSSALQQAASVASTSPAEKPEGET